MRCSIYVSFNQYSSVLRGDQDKDKEILALHFTKNNGVQQEWIPEATDYRVLPVVVVADAGHVVADVIVCHGYRLSIWQHGTSSGSWQGTRQQNKKIAGSWLLDIDKRWGRGSINSISTCDIEIKQKYVFYSLH